MSVLSDKLKDVFINIHNKFVDVNSSIDELFDAKADKAEIPTKVSELENNTNYVTNTDYATTDVGGVVKVATSGNTYGIIRNSNNIIQISCAEKSDIKSKGNYNKPITPINLDYAVEVCTNQTMSDDNTEAQGQLPASYNAVKTYVDDGLTTKADKTNIVQESSSILTFAFGTQYNTEIRAGELEAISLWFLDGGYESDYTAGISFDSGEIPTVISYTTSGILNWVGTDCATDSYVNSEGVTVPISIFQPSPNTHYDIVFYFNGVQFIGLVNGFVPATGNVVSEQ